MQEEFQRTVASNFDTLSKEDPSCEWVVVDASQSIDDIHKQVGASIPMTYADKACPHHSLWHQHSPHHDWASPQKYRAVGLQPPTKCPCNNPLLPQRQDLTVQW